MAQSKRRYDKNLGWMHFGGKVPDNLRVVAAVIVTKDEYGSYGSTFLPQGDSQSPSEEIQEQLGGMVATAHEIANL